tara:strand:+ start:267 stop:557 length:291 start_codon:yes stop_codon:yes gene_type:complete
MPIASKTYLESEVERLNKTIGTNLVLGKSDSGYTIFCDSSRTSEINCCMKYRDVISFLVTMRSFFWYKDLKNQVFEKIQTDKQNDVLFELSKLGTN